MLFPRDENQREQFRASAMAQQYAEFQRKGASEQELSSLHRYIGTLWDLPQSPQKVLEDGYGRTRRACLSGHVLGNLISLAIHHPNYCKVETAKVFVAQFVRRATGESVSESLIEKAWAEFKPVSHFWASWILCLDEGIAGSNPFSPGNEAKFLGVAEQFRRLGESARVLVSGEAWTAEGRAPAVEISINPIEGEQLEFLRRSFPG